MTGASRILTTPLTLFCSLWALQAAPTKPWQCCTQVWVYEEADEVGGPSNLYVHHDILLPAFPLAVAWTDCR